MLEEAHRLQNVLGQAMSAWEDSAILKGLLALQCVEPLLFRCVHEIKFSYLRSDMVPLVSIETL